MAIHCADAVASKSSLQRWGGGAARLLSSSGRSVRTSPDNSRVIPHGIHRCSRVISAPYPGTCLFCFGFCCCLQPSGHSAAVCAGNLSPVRAQRSRASRVSRVCVTPRTRTTVRGGGMRCLSRCVPPLARRLSQKLANASKGKTPPHRTITTLSVTLTDSTHIFCDTSRHFST